VRIRPSLRLVLLGLLALVLAVGATGCGREDDSDANAASPSTGSDTGATEELSGSVEVDGSSTVGPLTTAAAEGFREEQPGVNVTVGIAGTGGGFERFCAGETDISNASRPIDEEEEAPVCADAGIEYTEIKVATDALTVVVNPENDWVDCLTTDQLAAIWGPDSKVKNWKDVPGGDFPDEPLVLAGPGTDSGTFDYFTDVINGEEGASRSDYTASEDDNVTVQAVESDKGAMGYFGFTYYEENQDQLKALAIDSGNGCVDPSAESAQDGSYAPLSRPLFIYVKNESLQRPEVAGFLRFYTENIASIAQSAQFIELTPEEEQEAADTLEQAIGATAR
jgi:phosphate transport system substrate-binding protein